MGSGIPVVSMDIRQLSVGVAVKHHAPTDALPISRLNHNKISNKKITKRSSFNPCRCFKLFIECFG